MAENPISKEDPVVLPMKISNKMRYDDLDNQPNLSVILPVHNEANALELVVSQWDTALRSVPGVRHVFIICEDG